MGTCDHVDLYFIRHGITEWNKEKRYLGHTDKGVCKGELIQLNKLKKQLNDIEFDCIYTSDLKRCQETVAYVMGNKSAFFDKRLREMNFGDWEGKTYEELSDCKQYQTWINDWENERPPNGESGFEFKARIHSFFDELFQQVSKKSKLKQTNLIVTHGGVIKYIVSHFVPNYSFWEITIKHGQGLHLTFVKEKGEWTCNSLLEVPIVAKEKL